MLSWQVDKDEWELDFLILIFGIKNNLLKEIRYWLPCMYVFKVTAGLFTFSPKYLLLEIKNPTLVIIYKGPHGRKLNKTNGVGPRAYGC